MLVFGTNHQTNINFTQMWYHVNEVPVSTEFSTGTADAYLKGLKNELNYLNVDVWERDKIGERDRVKEREIREGEREGKREEEREEKK